jgi:hypothetical protein
LITLTLGQDSSSEEAGEQGRQEEEEGFGGGDCQAGIRPGGEAPAGDGRTEAKTQVGIDRGDAQGDGREEFLKNSPKL